MKLVRYLCFVSGILTLAVTLLTCDWKKEDDIFGGNKTKTLYAKITYQSIVTGLDETPKSVTIKIGDNYSHTFNTNEVNIEFLNEKADEVSFECVEQYGTETFAYKLSCPINKGDLGSVKLLWDKAKPVLRARVLTNDGVPLPSFPVCLFSSKAIADQATSCTGALASLSTNAQGYVLFTSVENDKTYGLRTEGKIGVQTFGVTGTGMLVLGGSGNAPITAELKVQAVQTQKLRGTVTLLNLETNRNEIPNGAIVTLQSIATPAGQEPKIYTTTVNAQGAFEIELPYSNQRMNLAINYVQVVRNEKLTYSYTETITGPATNFWDLRAKTLNLTKATSGFVPIQVRYRNTTGVLLSSFEVCVFPDDISARRTNNCEGALVINTTTTNITNGQGYLLIMGLEENKAYTFKAWGKSAGVILSGIQPETAYPTSPASPGGTLRATSKIVPVQE